MKNIKLVTEMIKKAIKENNQKTKLVVIDNNTLGYIDPSNPTVAGVLKASGLRGSNAPSIGTVSIGGKKVRLATEKDFDDFNVSFTGYKKNPNEYEWKK